MEIAKILIEKKISRRRSELVEGTPKSNIYYDDPKITYFKQDEYVFLRDRIQSEYYSIVFRFVYETASRIEEARCVRYSDIDFVARSVQMINLKQRRGHNRLVYLSHEIIAALLIRKDNENLTADDFILAKKKGRPPVSRQAFSDFMKKLVTEFLGPQNIKVAHPHSLRHSRAIHLAQNGVALSKIHQLLGHKSIQNTLIYQRFANLELKEAADKTNASLNNL